jgi:hypothetical protein
MAALGNLQIDCSGCGQTLSVPVTVEPAGQLSDQPNTLNASLRIDLAFIAAHLAGHEDATTGCEGRAAGRS